MTEHALPEAFADLVPFAEWSVPIERDRHRKRVVSDLETVRKFYDAMLPRMEAIITYLNARFLMARATTTPDTNVSAATR
jgi:hypothetical protein